MCACCAADRPNTLFTPPPTHTHISLNPNPKTAACSALLAELRALGVTDLAVTSSVSLQHLPWDLAAEAALPPTLAPRLAFAVQKLEAISRLAAAAAGGGGGAAGGGGCWGGAVADSVEEIPREWGLTTCQFEV